MLKFIRPESKYIESHWEAFDAICKEKAYFSSEESFPLESTTALMTEVIEKDMPQILVIDTDKDICVGWCDALPKEDTVGYVGTGLLKEYREMGLGTKLLRELIVRAKEYGYHKLELDVRASNKRAIHVYEKIGFTVCGATENGFTSGDGAVTEDVLQMELMLA